MSDQGCEWREGVEVGFGVRLKVKSEKEVSLGSFGGRDETMSKKGKSP